MSTQSQNRSIAVSAAPGMPAAAALALVLGAASFKSWAQSEPVRDPPSWPTPAEYLDQKAERGEAPVATGAPVQTSAEPGGDPSGGEPSSGDPSGGDPSGGAPSGGEPSGSAPPGYTVQLGAFRDLSAVQGAARKLNDLEGLSILRSEREGEEWYVLVLGRYPTLQEAALAAGKYRETHPEGDIWLRSTEGLSPL